MNYPQRALSGATREEQVLSMEGAAQGITRALARSNLAALKQEVGDLLGAIDGYREVLA